MSHRCKDMLSYGLEIVQKFGPLPSERQILRHLTRELEKDFAGLSSDRTRDEAVRNTSENYALCSALWAMQGFPLIEPSHKLAASLMATSLSPQAVEHVQLPWSCFAVAVPEGMLSVLTETGSARTIEHIQVTRCDDGAVRVDAYIGETGGFLPFGATSFSDLCLATTGQELWNVNDGTPDHEIRLVSVLEPLVHQLVVGLCIELDQPRYREIVGERARKTPKVKRGEPKAWVFKLSREVRVDARPWIKQYLSGERGTAPTVQTLVRGHHKRQARGPGRKDRAWIHIEPYWRGPEDAPIAVRSTKISGETEDR